MLFQSAYYYSINYGGGNVSSIIQNIFDTNPTIFVFFANNGTFGDTQPGTYKYLYVNALNGQTISYPEGSIVYTQELITFLTENTPLACFKEDTFILTNKGYLPIQELRKGDLVKTLKHGYKTIDSLGKREIYHPGKFEERLKDQLYVYLKDDFTEVFEDLILTGCHSILVDDFVSEEQKQKTIEVNGKIYGTDNKYRLPACVDERASIYDIPGTFTIYHLALENDDYYMNYGIYANGLLVESCSKRYLKELSNMILII